MSPLPTCLAARSGFTTGLTSRRRLWPPKPETSSSSRPAYRMWLSTPANPRRRSLCCRGRTRTSRRASSSCPSSKSAFLNDPSGRRFDDDGLVEADLGRALEDTHQGALAVTGSESRALRPGHEGLAVLPRAVADVFAGVVG